MDMNSFKPSDNSCFINIFLISKLSGEENSIWNRYQASCWGKTETTTDTIKSKFVHENVLNAEAEFCKYVG